MHSLNGDVPGFYCDVGAPKPNGHTIVRISQKRSNHFGRLHLMSDGILTLFLGNLLFL